MADIDVITSKLEDRILGVRILASAILGAAAATQAETDLAVAVLEASTRNMTTDPEPREVESIAASFNRHMDAVLDAANASKEKASRVTRRADMAKAIDKAELLLIDRGYLAVLFTRIDDMTCRITCDDVPANVQSSAAYLDDVLAAQHPEIFKEWLIVRKFLGEPVEGVKPNSEQP